MLNKPFFMVAFVCWALSILSAGAVVHRYVDTDNGNNSNNGSSWALAKADLYRAMASVGTVSDAVVIHCRGSVADTNQVPGYNNSTTSEWPLTIQVDQEDRHDGVWDETKYRLVITDKTAFTVINKFQNIYGLQIKLVAVSNTYFHALSLNATTNSEGIINIAYNIIRGDLGAVAEDNVAIHTANNQSTNYIWNNVIFGFVNGAESLCIAGALYGNDIAHNNTIYNCYTGFYNGVGSTNKVLSVNNLFVNVPRPLAGNFTGTFQAGTDYNATDGAALLISPMTVTGGDGAHEQLNVSTAGLFVDAGANNFNLMAASSVQVRGAGKSDPASGLFSDDITGAERSIPWDIGAFKYTSAPALTTIGTLNVTNLIIGP
jgi:hypothetical protein